MNQNREAGRDIPVASEAVSSNLALAKERIADALAAAGEPERSVRIMAVTKTHSPETVLAVLAAGVTVLGENRISEGGRKISAVGKKAAEWHIIGPIHRREVRRAVRDFHSIDSIDRMELFDELAKRVDPSAPPRLLLEVNTSGEPTKHGFEAAQSVLEDALGRATELGLPIGGLFTVGPLTGGEGSSRRSFSRLRELRDILERSCSADLPELSMGMSDDFEAAVAEGATTVRLGRFLLGPRRIRR
jgi:pyridoxal phosphate enzyme (YggS family)